MNNLNSIFKELCKENINIIQFKELKNGFNCIAYQLIDKEDRKYFLKIFLNNHLNKHNRVQSEFSFIKFLNKNKFHNIPNIVLYNIKKNWILFEWLNGKQIDKLINVMSKD